MEFIDFCGSYHVVQCLKWLHFCLFDVMLNLSLIQRDEKSQTSNYKGILFTIYFKSFDIINQI